MSRPNIEDLLDRYLAGGTTAEENKLIEQWLDDHDTGSGAWAEMNDNSRKLLLDSVFDKLDTDAGADKGRVIALPKRTLMFRWMAAAAVALIFAGLYFLWTNANSGNVSLLALKVPANHTQLLALSDGSKIWVNSGSTFRYPAKFAGKRREVYLAGEAYFDIHHDADKPFLVHSGKVVITVLGTAFDIKSDAPSHGVTVTVLRGKVSVSDSGHLLAYLTPDRALHYNTLTRQVDQEKVNANSAINWQQESEMHFEEMNFEAAAKLLEQRFEVNISFANDKLRACRFSGTIGKGKSLDEILKIICAFNNASFHRERNGNIIIDGQGCS
jgi:transmembrane sensor